MEPGICLIAVAPMRSLPDHKSEMVNQILFGETCAVLETTDEWLHIELLADHYRGWVAKNQITRLDEALSSKLDQLEVRCAAEAINYVDRLADGIRFPVSGGSIFYFDDSGPIPLNNHSYQYRGALTNALSANQPERIPDNACIFLNTPYLWGGRSAFGIDCSGLVQLAFKMSGLKVPRDSGVQANQGVQVHLIHEALPGDLVFFDNEAGIINHVGIYIGQNEVVHAHGLVRIDKIDHHGIFNREINKYSHPLRLIKRIAHP